MAGRRLIAKTLLSKIRSDSFGSTAKVVIEALKQLSKPPRFHVVPTVAGFPAAAEASITAAGILLNREVCLVSMVHATTFDVLHPVWYELHGLSFIFHQRITGQVATTKIKANNGTTTDSRQPLYSLVCSSPQVPILGFPKLAR